MPQIKNFTPEEIDLLNSDLGLHTLLQNKKINPFKALEEIRYLKELKEKQRELIKLQNWVIKNDQKVVVLFEGRDAAGKSGAIRRITEYPLVEIRDQIATNPPKQKINTIVHQTWIKNSFGKKHAKSIMKFRELNKNLSFKLYTDESMYEYMKANWGDHRIFKVFKNALIGPLKTDIFRYSVLYDQGGYYFDISRGCEIPLTKLHNNNSKFILTYEDTQCYIPPSNSKLFKLKRPFNHILQWGLAFEKKNMFLKLLIEEVVRLYPFFKKI